MPILYFYKNNEYNNVLLKYDLDKITKFSTPEIINIFNKFKDIKKINDMEIGSIGDKLYDITINYKLYEFNLEKYNLNKIIIPDDFNILIFIKLLKNKRYAELIEFLLIYLSINFNNLRIDDNHNYDNFNNFINNLLNDLQMFIFNKTYYNTYLKHFIKENEFNELKDLTYMLLKYSDKGYHAYYNTDLDVD